MLKPPFTIKGEWIYISATEQIHHGYITIHDGKVIKKGRSANASLDTDAVSINYGNSIIIPGLINLHTHLLWTEAPKPEAEEGLPGWMRKLREKTREWTFEQWLGSINSGVKAFIGQGVTTLVDMTPRSYSIQTLKESGLRAFILMELFGLDGQKAAGYLKAVTDRFEKWEKMTSGSELLTIGIAPHSLYMIHPELLKRVTEFIRAEQIISQIHIGETLSERDYLTKAQGEWVKHFSILKINNSSFPFGRTAVDRLIESGFLECTPSLVHAIDLTKAEEKKMTCLPIIICPFSNNRLVGRMKEMNGGKINIGTDSLASGCVNLRREAQLAGIRDPYQALRLLTQEAASVLNFDRWIGTLDPGKKADLAVFPLQKNCSDPDAALSHWYRSEEKAKAVYVNGKIIN